MKINVSKLTAELQAAGIQTLGCNSNGVVWDPDNQEIQSHPDVAAIIAAHDPTLVPVITLEQKVADLTAQLAKLQADQSTVVDKMIEANIMTASDLADIEPVSIY
jgi:hypothetical protein